MNPYNRAGMFMPPMSPLAVGYQTQFDPNLAQQRQQEILMDADKFERGYLGSQDFIKQAGDIALRNHPDDVDWASRHMEDTKGKFYGLVKDKYAGDWGAAAPELSSKIADESRKWTQIQNASKMQMAKDEQISKAISEGKDVVFAKRINKDGVEEAIDPRQMSIFNDRGEVSGVDAFVGEKKKNQYQDYLKENISDPLSKDEKYKAIQNKYGYYIATKQAGASDKMIDELDKAGFFNDKTISAFLDANKIFGVEHLYQKNTDYNTENLVGNPDNKEKKNYTKEYIKDIVKKQVSEKVDEQWHQPIKSDASSGSDNVGGGYSVPTSKIAFSAAGLYNRYGTDFRSAHSNATKAVNSGNPSEVKGAQKAINDLDERKNNILTTDPSYVDAQKTKPKLVVSGFKNNDQAKKDFDELLETVMTHEGELGDENTATLNDYFKRAGLSLSPTDKTADIAWVRGPSGIVQYTPQTDRGKKYYEHYEKYKKWFDENGLADVHKKAENTIFSPEGYSADVYDFIPTKDAQSSSDAVSKFMQNNLQNLIPIDATSRKDSKSNQWGDDALNAAKGGFKAIQWTSASDDDIPAFVLHGDTEKYEKIKRDGNETGVHGVPVRVNPGTNGINMIKQISLAVGDMNPYHHALSADIDLTGDVTATDVLEQLDIPNDKDSGYKLKRSYEYIPTESGGTRKINIYKIVDANGGDVTINGAPAVWNNQYNNLPKYNAIKALLAINGKSFNVAAERHYNVR